MGIRLLSPVFAKCVLHCGSMRCLFGVVVIMLLTTLTHHLA